MKILVLGSNGQLGRSLRDKLKYTDHDVVFAAREIIDIIEFEATTRKIINISPDVVVNATAYTAVDKAEKERELADFINHHAVANIAKICNQLDCWLIHVSTDYVFDGKSSVPYKEDHKPNPQSAYGETKLKGEQAIQSAGCKHVIIRTSWVFSEYGNNFLKTMLRLGAERDELRIVDDQIGCPTYAKDIANSIVKIVSKLTFKMNNGLYHYCGDLPCSWYDFANEIFIHAKNNGLATPITITPIKTSAYPAPLKRPPFSVLDCSKIENEFELLPSNWRDGVKEVISKLKA